MDRLVFFFAVRYAYAVNFCGVLVQIRGGFGEGDFMDTLGLLGVSFGVQR